MFGNRPLRRFKKATDGLVRWEASAEAVRLTYQTLSESFPNDETLKIAAKKAAIKQEERQEAVAEALVYSAARLTPSAFRGVDRDEVGEMLASRMAQAFANNAGK